jgi:hypothetical protein
VGDDPDDHTVYPVPPIWPDFRDVEFEFQKYCGVFRNRVFSYYFASALVDMAPLCRVAYLSDLPNKANVAALSQIKKTFEKMNDLWITVYLHFHDYCGLRNFTLTTVGGRMICVLSVFSGIMIVAVMTDTLSNLITFSAAEKHTLALLQRQDALKRLRNVAGRIIMRWWMLKKGRVLTVRQSITAG